MKAGTEAKMVQKVVLKLAVLSAMGVLAVCSCLLAGQAGAAASFPTKPIRVIVPFAAGQSADTVIRLLAPKLGTALGQPVIIDNRGGAGGSVGTAFVVHAEPDGYTLLMATIGPMSQQPALNPKLPFSPVKDLAPVINVALTPQVLVANPAAGFHTVAELIEKARAAPGTINYASSGTGSNQHITMELFKSRTGINVLHIPFKGGAESYTSILGGDTPIMFDAIPAVLPYVQSGKLIALGISSPTRSPLLPNVPTLAEAGLKNIDAVGWMGLAAPAGTPDDVLETLNHTMQQVLDDPDIRAQMNKLAFTPAGGTRVEFGAFIQSENVKWGGVIRAAGITLN